MAGGSCSHCGLFKKSGVEDDICRFCRNRGKTTQPQTREVNPPPSTPSLPPSTPSLSVASIHQPESILTRLREIKLSNAAGQLDNKSMNDILIDFMISMIDVKKELCELRDRVTVLEEISARFEKIHPEEEVHPASSIAVAHLPSERGKLDGTLAGELIAALDIGLTHVNVERVQRVGATHHANGTDNYPGKLLIELDTTRNKIECLGKRAKENLKKSVRFKDVKLYQALSKSQMVERHNTKELMKAANMVDCRLNGMGRIVPIESDGQGRDLYVRSERGRGGRGRGERGGRRSRGDRGGRDIGRHSGERGSTHMESQNDGRSA